MATQQPYTICKLRPCLFSSNSARHPRGNLANEYLWEGRERKYPLHRYRRYVWASLVVSKRYLLLKTLHGLRSDHQLHPHIFTRRTEKPNDNFVLVLEECGTFEGAWSGLGGRDRPYGHLLYGDITAAAELENCAPLFRTWKEYICVQVLCGPALHRFWRIEALMCILVLYNQYSFLLVTVRDPDPPFDTFLNGLKPRKYKLSRSRTTAAHKR
ncbi:hypothetical protein PM082_002230 [Marasmius tenuissimus]|nr:hypothetical protein PM082_002230 [Marasmius tenuissimus]